MGHVLLTVNTVLASKRIPLFHAKSLFYCWVFSKVAASRAVIMQECLLGDCFVCLHKIRI